MGIFSSKKITYVASAAYNMSGDYTERMNYLKTIVLGGALGTGKSSFIGESVVTGLIDGPYSGQRALLRWAKQKYQNGVPWATIGGTSTIPNEVLNTYLQETISTPTRSQSGYMGNADAEEWARQFVLATYPDEGNDLNWTFNIANATPGSAVVTVDITGKGIFQVPMANYDGNAQYCYITYYNVVSGYFPPYPDPEPFTVTVGGSGVVWGYRKDVFGSIDTEPTTYSTLNSVLLNTSTNEISMTFKGNFDYLKAYSMIIDGAELEFKRREYSTGTSTFVYDGTDVLFVDGSDVNISFLQKEIIVPPVIEDQKGPFIAIYRYGSGNAGMEAAKPEVKNLAGAFMPFAPIRIENKFIDANPYKDRYYKPVKDFYKRASGGQKVNKLIDAIADNESLDDIDFAFMIYGVALNTKSNYCKQYLYEFFKTLMNEQTFTATDFAVWEAAIKRREQLASQAQSLNPNTSEGLEAYREYAAVYTPNLKYNTISQRSNWLPNIYQIYLHWCFCRLDNLNAADYPTRKKGEVWLENAGTQTVNTITITERRAGGGDRWYEQDVDTDVFSRFYIYQKHANGSVTRIFVFGLQQENIVYNGVADWISADDALKDDEESGLIVPIHMDTFKGMSLKAKNQVAVENTYILFNCYQIVKQKWYQKGIFKVVFALVIAIVSVFIPPIGAIGGAGILGSNVALGISMGFVGSTVTAAIAGAAVNAIAGMLVAQLVSGVVGSLFKGKLGAIIGTLIMFFGGMVANSLMSGGGFNFNWNEMFNAKNLLKLTESVTKAANAWYAADLSDIQAQMSSNTAKYEADMKHVQEKMEELLGTGGRGFLDPLMFTGEAEILNESSDSFLDRTLLTGSEIAELSMQMVNNFAEMNLQLPEAYI